MKSTSNGVHQESVPILIDDSYADIKIFVTADEEARAWRRHAELVNRGEMIEYDQVLAQLRERDARDAARSAAPMTKAEDAVELDTTDMSIDEAVKKAIEIVKARRG